MGVKRVLNLELLVSIEELVKNSVFKILLEEYFLWELHVLQTSSCWFLLKSMLLLTNSFGRVFFVGVKRFTNLKLLISIEELPDVKSQFPAAVCRPPRLLDQNL